MNYYQLPIIEPSQQIIVKLFFQTSEILKKRGLNICIAHARLRDLYCEISQLPQLGQDLQYIFNRTVEIAVSNVLKDLKHISKPSSQTILIRSGLKAKNKI
ncbi:hypothetical protein LDVICp057 [lymphocystis disease virus-China]|uniref:Uncharacterized protein n=2 Tax=Lymphocystis disease virus 2 TaxID=159183 RepID=A0A6F8X0E9_9VIRU|nr:hypothetical protein LDVICp057 [lymphocystis disease virus-China]AAU10903.1 hypothetical protein [lymphocystis disease virus-China]BCB67444.1 hypothetical protein [Lymphocystis disease virus 2]